MNRINIFDEKSLTIIHSKDIYYNKNSSILRKIFTCNIVRYVDNFIVVINDKKQAEILCNKIKTFLQNRSLNKNVIKSKFSNGKIIQNLTTLASLFIKLYRKKIFKNFVQSVFYVYPSKPYTNFFLSF